MRYVLGCVHPARKVTGGVFEPVEPPIEKPEEPEEPEEPSTPDEPTKPDEPTPDVPQTGGSRAALWVGALLILALGGLGIVLILLKRQNKQ